jgi:hypothetical protein
VIEYIAPTKRRKMTKPRRATIFLSRNGICYICRKQIMAHVDPWFIEHPGAVNLGGSDNDEDLWPAHVKCKPKKDAEDAALISDRNSFIDKNCVDAPRKSRPMAGTRASGIRKRMNGRVERWT